MDRETESQLPRIILISKREPREGYDFSTRFVYQFGDIMVSGNQYSGDPNPTSWQFHFTDRPILPPGAESYDFTKPCINIITSEEYAGVRLNGEFEWDDPQIVELFGKAKLFFRELGIEIPAPEPKFVQIAELIEQVQERYFKAEAHTLQQGDKVVIISEGKDFKRVHVGEIKKNKPLEENELSPEIMAKGTEFTLRVLGKRISEQRAQEIAERIKRRNKTNRIIFFNPPAFTIDYRHFSLEFFDISKVEATTEESSVWYYGENIGETIFKIDENLFRVISEQASRVAERDDEEVSREKSIKEALDHSKGDNFADALKRYAARQEYLRSLPKEHLEEWGGYEEIIEGSLDFSRIPTGPENLRFKGIEIEKISQDRLHALAITRHQNDPLINILRDGEMIMTLSESVRIAAATPNLDAFVVSIDEKQFDRSSMSFLVDNEGKVAILNKQDRGYLVGTSSDFTHFLFANMIRAAKPPNSKDLFPYQNRTIFTVVNTKGQIVRSFEIDDFYFKAEIKKANEDLSQVLWYGEPLGKRKFFRNDEELGKGDRFQVLGVSPDFSRVLFTTEEGGKKTKVSKISLNRKVLFAEKEVKIGRTYVNGDVSLGVIEIIDRKGRRKLFRLTHNKGGIIGGNFEQLVGIEDKGDHLVATVVEKGKTKQYTIS